MNTKTCPTCERSHLVCDRCGQNPPEFHPPTPFNGTLNASADIRICKTCYKDLVSIVWAFFGYAYPVDFLP